VTLRIAEPADRTLTRLLELQAERWGTRPLVRCGSTTLSVEETRELAARRAGALAAAGIEPGDRVAVLSENRLQVLELWLGCAWRGAVLVPVNTALRGVGLAHVLRDSGARVLAVERELEPPVESPSPVVWRIERLPAPGDEIEPYAARPEETAALLYTSGTTGPAKGVTCPHAQWYWWAVHTGEVLGVDAESVLYTSLPLFHTNALNTLCQALVSGATFVIGPRFSASAFWSRLAEADATHTYLLGPMVSILLRREPSELDRAHHVRVALAPGTPAELHAPFRERFGVRLIDAWGSTETNCVIANDLDDIRPGTMGVVREGFEARVDDTTGELLVRSKEPLAFATGYFNLPDATAQAWRGGWFHSGDRVARDADGRFRFVDRIKDAIRRRGENISSWEVEETLVSHPDVAAAAAVGVPSELGEDEVLACVVPRAGAVLDPAELIRFCDGRLAYFAIPRYVEFVDALPLTPSGKIEKYRLRERGVTDATWDREAAGVKLTRR
jgi:crotonobetaine/carnitine-CoA ligase